MALVIPHRNTPGILGRCLASLRDTKPGPDVKVLVVDDASNTPETKQYFEENPDVAPLKLLARVGFTGAVNAGIQSLIRSDNRPSVIGLVNSDLEFKQPEWLELCLESFDRDHEELRGKRNAIMAPMLVMPDGDTIQWGGESSSLREPGRHKTGSRKAGDCGERAFVRWHTFACVLIRTEALLDVGLLDPNFQMICSDSDWCLRARWRQWRCVYEPAAVVVHAQSQTIQREARGSGGQNFQGVLFQDQQFLAAKWGGRAFQALDQGPIEQQLGVAF